MRHLLRALVFAAIAAIVAGRMSPVSDAAPLADTVTLRVDGRANATPWVAASGAFVAVAWGASADGKTDVFLAVSRDGGRLFGAPIRVNADAGQARLGGELPPRVALAARAGREPDIVVLWTARGATTSITMARSADAGRTFSTPIALQAADAAGDRGWPALALDATGAAHAVWLDHRGLAAGKATTAHEHRDAGEHDGVAMAQKSGLYYAALGARVSQERELTAGVCYCCKTALTVGLDGTLYAAWRHVYPSNLRDIAFTLSRDGGRTFTAPTRVSEDRWQLNGCPDDGPAMAVDRSGTVHVIWPTVLPGPEPQGALFYASTRDGRTFTPRMRVPTLGSPKPSHPQIALDASGDIVVAWDEVINGIRTAVARRARRAEGNRVAFSDAIRLALEGPATYPVLASAADGFVVAWTSGAPAASVIQVRRLPSDH